MITQIYRPQFYLPKLTTRNHSDNNGKLIVQLIFSRQLCQKNLEAMK